jgi:hypothetical protein
MATLAGTVSLPVGAPAVGMGITSAPPPPPTDVCVVDDPRATELSGLVATPTGYVAVNDGQDRPSLVHIVYLDAACKVTKVTPYPTAARDPEDIAVAPDGTLWVADTGDNITNDNRRTTIALWKVPPTGPPVIHRLTYPDGPHDAEALLFGADGRPIVITKEVTGIAGLYVPAADLQANSQAGVKLRKAGEFRARANGENNSLGALGEVLVTGAARSPDGRKVALRTYTAAYEWDVTDGDIVKAITTTTPRLTALPDEPQGEAIAYSTDGTAFLTLSDEPRATTLRQTTPSTAALVTAPPSGSPPPAPPPTGLAAVPLWLTLPVAAIGLAIAAVGFLGLRRSRRPEDGEPTDETTDEPEPTPAANPAQQPTDSRAGTPNA